MTCLHVLYIKYFAWGRALLGPLYFVYISNFVITANTVIVIVYYAHWKKQAERKKSLYDILLLTIVLTCSFLVFHGERYQRKPQYGPQNLWNLNMGLIKHRYLQEKASTRKLEWNIRLYFIIHIENKNGLQVMINIKNFNNLTLLISSTGASIILLQSPWYYDMFKT